MGRLDQTNGVGVADEAMRGEGRGPGVAVADKASESLHAEVSGPSRMPGRRNNGHTTSGADYAMQTLANRLHPV